MRAIRCACAGLALAGALAVPGVATPAAAAGKIKLPAPAEGTVNLGLVFTAGKPATTVKGAAPDTVVLTKSSRPRASDGVVRTLIVVANRTGQESGGRPVTIGLNRRPVTGVRRTVDALATVSTARRVACAPVPAAGKLVSKKHGGLTNANAKIFGQALLRVICGGASEQDSTLLTLAGINPPTDSGGGGGGGALGAISGRIVYRSGSANNNLFRASATGGTPENLSAAIDALSPNTVDEFVNVSPDGGWLLIGSDRFGCGGYPCLSVVRSDLSAGAAVQVPQVAGKPGEFDGLLHGDFSAIASAGNRVVLVSGEGPHVRDLWAISLIGGTPTAGTWSEPVLLSGASSDPYNYQPAISDDGNQVLFNCATNSDPQAGDQAICRVNADGTGFVEVVNGKARSEPHQDGIEGLHHPDFLAAGAGIAFESTWKGRQSIWTLASGSTVPQQLPAATTNNVAPCVLPSGHVVSLDLTRAGNPAGLHELMIADLTTTNRSYPAMNIDVLDAGYGCGA